MIRQRHRGFGKPGDGSDARRRQSARSASAPVATAAHSGSRSSRSRPMVRLSASGLAIHLAKHLANQPQAKKLPGESRPLGRRLGRPLGNHHNNHIYEQQEHPCPEASELWLPAGVSQGRPSAKLHDRTRPPVESPLPAAGGELVGTSAAGGPVSATPSRVEPGSVARDPTPTAVSA
jgi:hypothetical protein